MLVSNYFPPGFIGGYELGALDFASWLVDQGAQVRVLTGVATATGATDSLPPSLSVARELSIAQEGSRVESLFGGLLVNDLNIGRVIDSIADFALDAVVCFGLAGIGAPGLLRFLELTGIPSVAVLMDDPMRDIPKELLEVFEHAYGAVGSGGRGPGLTIFSMSGGLTDQLRTSGVKGAIHQFCGWTASVPGERRGRRSVDAAGVGRPFRFVFSSRVAPHKGISILIEAIHEVRTSGLPAFEVDIYGEGLVAEAMTQAAAMDLGDVIRYRGSLEKSEMALRFADYDALLFPTWEREPFGFVVAEAAAQGCVPIMTSSIGAAEWFIDGVDSLKCMRTSKSFSNAISFYMQSSTEVRLGLAEKAQDTASRYMRPRHWMTKLSEPLLVPSPVVDVEHLSRLRSAFGYLALEASRLRNV